MLSLIDTVGRYVAVPATLGLLLLLPLYLSTRRDLVRLRTWMDRDPNHPPADLAASEALLDRAETDLEALLAERGEPAAATATATAGPATVVQPPPAQPAPAPAPTTGVTPIPAAQRVTSERPALERITMERAALEPHPRWRRFAGRLARPRTLVLIAIGAVTLAAAALVGSHELLDTGAGKPSRPQHHPGAVVPRDVTVAVLNGTSTPGLAALVGQTLHENGFKEGTISATRKQYQQTVVMYAGGQKKAAERVAHVLGAKPIQRIDKTTRAIAGSAPVVVIAGADRIRR